MHTYIWGYKETYTFSLTPISFAGSIFILCNNVDKTKTNSEKIVRELVKDYCAQYSG